MLRGKANGETKKGNAILVCIKAISSHLAYCDDNYEIALNFVPYIIIDSRILLMLRVVMFTMRLCKQNFIRSQSLNPSHKKIN